MSVLVYVTQPWRSKLSETEFSRGVESRTRKWKPDNVVNCRAYYILLNAVDHQVYRCLQAFSLPHVIGTVVFLNSNCDRCGSNQHNKYQLSQKVYHRVLQNSVWSLFMNHPSKKEKFQRVCNEKIGQRFFVDTYNRKKLGLSTLVMQHTS